MKFVCLGYPIQFLKIVETSHVSTRISDGILQTGVWVIFFIIAYLVLRKRWHFSLLGEGGSAMYYDSLQRSISTLGHGVCGGGGGIARR
jgi:hypothetical protein